MDNNYETQKTELCKHKEKLIKWFLWISASPTQNLRKVDYKPKNFYFSLKIRQFF